MQSPPLLVQLGNVYDPESVPFVQVRNSLMAVQSALELLE